MLHRVPQVNELNIKKGVYFYFIIEKATGLNYGKFCVSVKAGC